MSRDKQRRVGAEKTVMVNLLDCEDLKCGALINSHDEKGEEEKVCGNNEFVTKVILKKVPAMVSPTGREMIIPTSYYYCARCGNQLRDEGNQPFAKIDA